MLTVLAATLPLLAAVGLAVALRRERAAHARTVRIAESATTGARTAAEAEGRRRGAEAAYLAALQSAGTEAEVDAVLLAHLRLAIDGAEADLAAGDRPPDAVDVPLMVAGAAFATVRLRRPEPLTADELHRARVAAAHAAPVLALLRALHASAEKPGVDAATGLADARGLQDQLRRLGAISARAMQPLAALVLVPDGDAAGDPAAVAAIGRLVAARVRDSDVAARAGDGAFCVLLPDTEVEGGEVLGEQLRLGVRGLRAGQAGVRPMTCSIGVAAYPFHAFDPATLLRKAHAAQVEAHALGGDVVRTAPAPTAEDARSSEG